MKIFSLFFFKLKEIKGSVSTLVRAKIGPNNGDKLKTDDKIFFNKSNSTGETKKIKLAEIIKIIKEQKVKNWFLH